MSGLRTDRRGYLLVEASITVVVLASALVALIVLLVISLKANVNSDASLVSTQLSTALLEEIRLRKWDEKTPAGGGRVKSPSAIGRDGGAETASDKTTYDDIDDFNGWTQTPPKDPLMRALPEFSEYTSSAAVRYLNADLTPFSGGGTKPDYKQVTVCTWRAKRKSICLDTVLTNR